MITEKKSQITDISVFSYWLHQKGVGIYDDLDWTQNVHGHWIVSYIKFNFCVDRSEIKDDCHGRTSFNIYPMWRA